MQALKNPPGRTLFSIVGLTGPRTGAFLEAPPSEAGRPVAIAAGEGAIQLDAALRGLPRVQDLDQARRLLAITARINAGSSLDDVMDHIYESFRSVIPMTGPVWRSCPPTGP